MTKIIYNAIFYKLCYSRFHIYKMKGTTMETYNSNIIPPKISIAPMVDVTHKHFRYFTRLMTKDALLYTEMVSAKSILYGDIDKILGFNEEEGKVALQIAASNPDDAYNAIKLAEDFNYSEINLNCGCPSDRVSGNLMGAALMSSKNLVYEILCAMKEATSKPITIKHRIGIDGTGVIDDGFGKQVMEGYDDLIDFLETVSRAKPDRYIIHARTAILKGLSPKENRQIPPLDHDMVYRLKEEFNYFNIEINGGFKTLSSIKDALTKVDGVMLGRVAFEDCYLLAHLHKLWQDENERTTISRGELIKAYEPYVQQELEKGISIYTLVEPLQSLFHGQKGNKYYKQLLASPSVKKERFTNIIDQILNKMPHDLLWGTTYLSDQE